jgi:hypothetical protein
MAAMSRPESGAGQCARQFARVVRAICNARVTGAERSGKIYRSPIKKFGDIVDDFSPRKFFARSGDQGGGR